MKTIVWWSGLALAVAGLSSVYAANSSLQQVKQSGVLKVCTTGDYPPLTQYSNGEYHGKAIQAAMSFARYLGVKAQFVKTTWPTLSKDVASGKCDIAMGGISLTSKRENNFLLSKPVLAFGKSILVRCDNVNKFNSLKALNQPSVRVVENKGGTNEKFARKSVPKATLIIVKNNKLPFSYLLKGKADAMLTDNIEAVYRQKTTPGLCAVNPNKPFTKAYKVYMLPKQSEALLGAVNQWLSKT